MVAEYLFMYARGVAYVNWNKFAILSVFFLLLSSFS
jgi:hypothetical protein